MTFRRLLSFLALAVVACPALAVAQGTGTLRGRVTDATSGSPLAGVQVRVDGTGVGSQTSPDGTFVIVGAPAGSHSITARRVGYTPTRAAVTIPEAGVATQTKIGFELDEAEQQPTDSQSDEPRI